MIVEDFVCSKSSPIDLLAKYFPRMSLNALHCSKICLTVRGQLHLSHADRLSSDRRCLCVRRACPMRSLVIKLIMVLSRRVRPCSHCHTLSCRWQVWFRKLCCLFLHSIFLPCFIAQLSDSRKKVTGWIFHTFYWQTKSWLCRSVSPVSPFHWPQNAWP